MKKLLIPRLLAAACGRWRWPRLPAPVLSDEAKAKAAEAAAKTAWTGKVDAYQLCKAQDKVAAALLARLGQGAPARQTKPPDRLHAACADPGPFAYTPPEAEAARGGRRAFAGGHGHQPAQHQAAGCGRQPRQEVLTLPDSA